MGTPVSDNRRIIGRMPKKNVYLETSFISYLTSRPSRDIVIAGHQAITHNMSYLLTWNCKHIANANRRQVIEQISLDYGYSPPIICTPEELTGEH